MHKATSTYLIGVAIALSTGCATDQNVVVNSSEAYQGYAQVTPDPALQQAAQAIVNGNPEYANELLNAVLRTAPKNPLANLLNGMAYQARSGGEGPQWDMAKIGYQLARKFDPYLWQAPYLLGMMKLKERSPAAAMVAFSEAALASPFNAAPLYALAAASYAQGDLKIAYGAMQKAMSLDKGQPTPRDRHIITLCSAAVGDFAAAAAQIVAMRNAGVPVAETQWLERKLRTWQEFYANLDTQPLNNLQPVAAVTDSGSNAGGVASPRAAVIEAIILRTASADSTSRGVNLLDGLSAQFEGVLINSSRNRVDDLLTNQLTSDQKTLINSVQLSVPAVKYSLNIANSTDSSSRMVGNPSVLALDGKESKFFIGSELTVFMTGDISSAATKEFGLSIQVTPTFLADDTVQLQVESGLSTLNSSKPPGINMDALALEKVTNTAAAIMHFGETLLVSTGTLYQEINQQSGVPILNKTPVIDNLFSRRSTGTSKGTLLILLTLKPAQEQNLPTSPASALFANNTAVMRVQQRFAPLAPQIQEQLTAIHNREVLRIIRPTDVAPINPVYTEDLDATSRQWRQQFMSELVAN